MSVPADWLLPAWRADGVGAFMTTRSGGVSVGPHASMNVGVAVDDDPARVAENRRRLALACGAAPVYLRQVHGTHVVRVGRGDAVFDGVPHEADASVTTEPGVACVIQAADCLPVLLAAPGGRGVAAAHAGWRGLAGGVVEAAVSALCEASGCVPSALDAWLGACIGREAFEVGADVLGAFASGAAPTRAERFRPIRPGKWFADLAGLAHDRLAHAGVQRISGGEHCTVNDASRFFSYRRDRFTGRMAAAIWIRGAA